MRYISVILLIIILLIAPFSNGVIAYADEITLEDELAGFDIDGVPFNFDDYPVDETDNEVYILTFIEYNYNDNCNINPISYFLYIYNPSCIVLSKDKKAQNWVHVATVYDENNQPMQFNGVRLTYVSSTDDELFYKYELSYVMPSAKWFYELKAELSDDLKRRYDFKNLILSNNNGDLIEFNKKAYISFKYTGYRDGLKPYDEAADIHCDVGEFVLLTESAFDTYYREPHGLGFYPELDSLYFSVDNDILNNFELFAYNVKLYRYYTAPILFLSDDYFNSRTIKNVNLCLMVDDWGGDDLNVRYVENEIGTLNTLGLCDEVYRVYNDEGYLQSALYNWTYNVFGSTYDGANIRTNCQLTGFGYGYKQNAENIEECYVSKYDLSRVYHNPLDYGQQFYLGDGVWSTSVQNWHEHYKYCLSHGDEYYNDYINTRRINPWLVGTEFVRSVEHLRSFIGDSYYHNEFFNIDDPFDFVIDNINFDNHVGSCSQSYDNGLGVYFGDDKPEIKLFNIFDNDNISSLYIDENEQSKIIDYSNTNIEYNRSTILMRLGFSDYYQNTKIHALEYYLDPGPISESTEDDVVLAYDMGIGGASVSCETIYMEPEITLYFKNDIDYISTTYEFDNYSFDTDIDWGIVVMPALSVLFLILLVLSVFGIISKIRHCKVKY